MKTIQKTKSRNALYGLTSGLLVLAAGIGNILAAEQVDLGDIVGGGDGSGNGAFNTGIKQRDGGFAGTTWANFGNAGASVFEVVAFNPLVDGVFLPTNLAAPTPISTTGISYQFPATNGLSWDAIRNGVSVLESNSSIRAIYDMDGAVIDVGVGIHANGGITYDLDAIRSLHPALSIERFTGHVGGITGSGSAIAYILVDGVSVFSQQVGNTAALSTAFDIPIESTARFLTLASTDMGNYGSDKVYFGNALLHVKDITPPTITCPPDVSVAFGSVPAAATDPAGFLAQGGTITDNCDPNGSVTSFDLEEGYCPTIITRLYIVTDAAGNESTCEQIITVNNLFAEDGILWLQPLARKGMSSDTDPSDGGTLKYRFKLGSTIPIKVQAQGCDGNVSSNANVIGKIVVFGDTDMDGVIDANEAAMLIDYNGVGEAGGVMDKVDGKLQFNLDTKKLVQTFKCYILQVTVTDSSTGESRTEIVPLQAK